MVTVYIWKFRGKTEAWGHVSMLVEPGTYISWWPEDPGQVPSKIHRNIYESHPYRDRAYVEDVAAEGQLPDVVIDLKGLDEGAIKDWWQSFGLTRDGIHYAGPLPSWATLKRNCSTVVATGLKIGGGDRYASWFKSWNMVWTPQDVQAYAESIRDGLARQAAH